MENNLWSIGIVDKNHLQQTCSAFLEISALKADASLGDIGK